MTRTATIERKTKETDIHVALTLDGTGESEVSTGIGFFDHMLEGFARHGFFDLSCHVAGDLHVDGHHTVDSRLHVSPAPGHTYIHCPPLATVRTVFT